jgi:predicted amidophosphoribosyltransferase
MAADFTDAVVIPIPSSRTGYLSRGFSPSLEIARATDLPVVDCLSLSDPRTQRGLDRSARTARRVSLRAPVPAVGSRAVLVDDVVTTGASIDAATEACWRAGIRVIGVLALAVAPVAHHGVATLPNSQTRV